MLFFSRLNQYLPAFACLLAILFLVLDIFVVTKDDRDKGINMHISDFNVSETFMDTADSLFCYYNLKLKLCLNTLTSKLHFSKIPKKVKKVSSMFDPWSIWIYNIRGGGGGGGICGYHHTWYQ